MIQILAVDDDHNLLQLIQDSIATALPSVKVLTAQNGLQALEILAKYSIQLLITDLRMPQMDGFELLAQVMANYPDIGVIVTTGHSIPQQHKPSLEKGALEILFKPLKINTLRRCIQNLLAKQADGGTLHNVSPATFMQLIDMEQKTCTIRIRDQKTGRMGVLFFRNGKLLNCRMNSLQGKDATLEVFSWDNISLAIENDCPVQEARINQTLNGLILEAIRMKDEREAASNQDKSAPPAQETTSADYKTNRHMAAFMKRLRCQPELKGFVHQTRRDEKWGDLLTATSSLAALFNLGRLKAVAVTPTSGRELMILPDRPPAVLSLENGCPKEKLFALLD